VSDQDYQELHTEVGEAIRAGEAQPVDMDAIKAAFSGVNYILGKTNVSAIVMSLVAEIERLRLRAASDATERDTRQMPRAKACPNCQHVTLMALSFCTKCGQGLASPRASAATEEQARRKFMQFHNRYLGWGFDDSGEPHRKENAGVMFTSEGWSRPYERFTLFEKYADHGGDINATECAVIDKAMAAYVALSSPSPAPTGEK
jgi:hypothetical protein